MPSFFAEPWLLELAMVLEGPFSFVVERVSGRRVSGMIMTLPRASFSPVVETIVGFEA
jgi:hypothetical protein